MSEQFEGVCAMKKTRGDAFGIDRGVEASTGINTVATSNAEGFARILRVYARPGQTIADVTYGKGAFWKDTEPANYDARLTDISSGVDFTKLPYKDESIDLLVIDPPYRYTPQKHITQDSVDGHGRVDGQYRLTASKLKNTKAVIDLYMRGATEARRVLRFGGFLIMKCQDTVQDGKNIWVSRILAQQVEDLGFSQRDMLVVCPRSVLASRWKYQRHLRKAHSFFLVFRKGGHFPFGVPSMQRR